jgi:hypothetical protein
MKKLIIMLKHYSKVFARMPQFLAVGEYLSSLLVDLDVNYAGLVTRHNRGWPK